MLDPIDYEVKLEIFQGPLDLLIHLIRKNEVDIFDIPIATITDQYLEYLELMKALNITLAGDFLVMASTLIHIKSKMLLPGVDTEDEEDPRIEITRPLMEYLRLKEVAGELSERDLLDRDVFARHLNVEYLIPACGCLQEDYRRKYSWSLLKGPGGKMVDQRQDNDYYGKVEAERLYIFSRPFSRE